MASVIKNIKISGVGIHSGLPVNMIIKPSKKPGIFFLAHQGLGGSANKRCIVGPSVTSLC